MASNTFLQSAADKDPEDPLNTQNMIHWVQKIAKINGTPAKISNFFFFFEACTYVLDWILGMDSRNHHY